MTTVTRDNREMYKVDLKPRRVRRAEAAKGAFVPLHVDHVGGTYVCEADRPKPYVPPRVRSRYQRKLLRNVR